MRRWEYEQNVQVAKEGARHGLGGRPGRPAGLQWSVQPKKVCPASTVCLSGAQGVSQNRLSRARLAFAGLSNVVPGGRAGQRTALHHILQGSSASLASIACCRTARRNRLPDHGRQTSCSVGGDRLDRPGIATHESIVHSPSESRTDPQWQRTRLHASVVTFVVAFLLFVVGCSDRDDEIRPDRTFRHPTGCVGALTFSPDGRMLAAGSAGVIDGQDQGTKKGAVYVWDVKTADQIASLRSSQWINSLAYVPDGTTLIGGSGWFFANPEIVGYLKVGELCAPGEVIFWDTAKWAEKAKLKLAGAVISVAVSPDGKWLASLSAASRDPKGGTLVTLWGLSGLTQELQFKLDGYAYVPVAIGPSRLLAFSPDSKVLAVCCSRASRQPAEVRICDMESQAMVASLAVGESPVRYVTFSSDSQELTVTGTDLTVWDTRCWKCVRRWGGADLVAERMFEKTEVFLLTSSAYGTTRFGISDIPVSTNKLECLARCVSRAQGFRGTTMSLAISPDRTMVASGGSLLGEVYLWSSGLKMLRQRQIAPPQEDAVCPGPGTP